VSRVAILTGLAVGGIVWGGLLLLVITAARKERAKGRARDGEEA
jgi:hypothetical protein